MNLSWDKDAWEDYIYWQQTDKGVLRRINELVNWLRNVCERPLREKVSRNH